MPLSRGVGNPGAFAATADTERQRIMQALEKSAGNQTNAAKLLGISLRTLVTRIEPFGLRRPRKA